MDVAKDVALNFRKVKTDAVAASVLKTVGETPVAVDEKGQPNFLALQKYRRNLITLDSASQAAKLAALDKALKQNVK